MPLDVRYVVDGFRNEFALTNVVISSFGRATIIDGVNLWPIIPPQEMEDEEFMVDPSTITSKHLRAIVIAMSPQGDASAASRERFQSLNVFPNTVFDACCPSYYKS